MQRYARPLLRAREEAIRHFARNLHDDTMQKLDVVCWDIDEIIAKCRDTPKTVLYDLKQVRLKLSKCLEDLHRFCHSSRTTSLIRCGLASSLKDLVAEISEEGSFKCKLRFTGINEWLPADVEDVVFRIVQEALNNVRKHAKASRVVVEVYLDNNKVNISINDDGQGIDLIELLDNLRLDGKLGLIGIIERVALFRGIIEIESKPGKGSSLNIELPR